MIARALVLVVAALALFASVAPAATPPRAPGELVVALSLASEGMQAGAVRGSEVTFARGFEVELARAIARRMGVGRVRFVHVADPSRLVAAGSKRWDLGIAQLVPTGRARARVDFSRPYLAAGPALLLGRGVERPRRQADLRSLQLCTVRGTRAAAVVAGKIRPRAPQLRLSGMADLLRSVRIGRCDAALAEPPALATALASERFPAGTLAAVLELDRRYAVALSRGDPLRARVDQALRRLAADGTLHRLAREWLGVDPSRLPRLR